MVISRERLSSALTAQQYVESMDTNRELFEENAAATVLTAGERGFFAALPAPLDVLVLTEDWCGDSAANLPIVARLAQETGGLTLHILRREGNEDISDRYQLDDGRNHIPTYIVLDAELNEIGHFIERPAAVTEKLDAFKASWFAEHPELGDGSVSIRDMEPEVRERYLTDQRAYRRGLRDLEQREMVAAFRAIASRAPVAGGRSPR
jgi:hypothetical protein